MPPRLSNSGPHSQVRALDFRHFLLAGMAAGGLLLGVGLSVVQAQETAEDELDDIFAIEDTEACANETEDGSLLEVEDDGNDVACGGGASGAEAAASAEIADEGSDEADEITSLFDEEDEADNGLSDTLDDDADVVAEGAGDGAAADADADMARAGDASGNGSDGSGGEGDMSLAAAGDGMSGGPGDDAGAEGGAASGGSGEAGDGSIDSASAGSDSADIAAGGGDSGSLIAVGVGKGLTEAQNDPTTLDSLADVVVGTDQENGDKDNVAQVTALGGVTNGGSLNIGVLEVIDGDTDDPMGQVLLIDADNPPAPGEVPSVDGIAEVNVGDDPDGQSFNLVQVDAFDDNFLPDGSSSLANIAVGDGLDEGFGSLLGVTINDTSNDGEHDNLADVALGGAFDPLAEPLAPLTEGLNGLGVTLGEGLAPVLGPIGDAIP